MYEINDFMAELELLTEAKTAAKTVSELNTAISKTLVNTPRETRTEMCENLIEARNMIDATIRQLKTLINAHYAANKEEINNGYADL